MKANCRGLQAIFPARLVECRIPAPLRVQDAQEEKVAWRDATWRARQTVDFCWFSCKIAVFRVGQAPDVWVDFSAKFSGA
jgi:hypothetical protein